MMVLLTIYEDAKLKVDAYLKSICEQQAPVSIVLISITQHIRDIVHTFLLLILRIWLGL